MVSTEETHVFEHADKDHLKSRENTYESPHFSTIIISKIRDIWLLIDKSEQLLKRLNWRHFDRERQRKCEWDSIPSAPLRKYFKRIIKPSTICQSRLRMSTNTWTKSIWRSSSGSTLSWCKKMDRKWRQPGQVVYWDINCFFVQGHVSFDMLISVCVYIGLLFFMINIHRGTGIVKLLLHKSETYICIYKNDYGRWKI